MVDRWLRRADQDRRVGPALRVYLWWGVLVRSVLLVAMGTLLLVEGNFLAEWLLSGRLVPSVGGSAEDIAEYTAISYALVALFLGVGAYVRWLVIQRMNATPARTPGAAADSEAPGDGERA